MHSSEGCTLDRTSKCDERIQGLGGQIIMAFVRDCAVDAVRHAATVKVDNEFYDVAIVERVKPRGLLLAGVPENAGGNGRP